MSVVLAYATTLSTGIGWDSGIDTHAAIEMRSLMPGMTLTQAYESIYSTSEFYGILIQSAADGLSQLGGGSGFLSPAELHTYRLQGIVTTTLMLLAVIASAAVTGIVLASRLAAMFVWATGLSIPLVMGLTALDFKDAPVAAGLVLVSSGIALAAAGPTVWRAWAPACAMVAIGTFVTLGVRVGAWPLVGALLVASLLVLGIGAVLKRAWTRVLQLGGVAAGGVLAGLIGLILLNPLARIDLPRWVYDAYLTSSSFPWEGTVRTMGQDLDATNLPWWYAPAWFGAQLPIVGSVAAMAGLVFWARLLLRQREQPIGTPLALTPFVAQALLLPTAIVLSGAVLYDGVRHLLFVVPALVVVMASGMAWADHQPEGQAVWPRNLVAAALLLVPVASLIADLRWFPYQYAHLNILASDHDGSRDWEVDYWGVSVVEAADRLRDLGIDEIRVMPEIDPKGTAEVVEITLATEDLDRKGSSFGTYAFARSEARLPDDCQEVFTIERAGVVLGAAGLCVETVVVNDAGTTVE